MVPVSEEEEEEESRRRDAFFHLGPAAEERKSSFNECKALLEQGQVSRFSHATISSVLLLTAAAAAAAAMLLLLYCARLPVTRVHLLLLPHLSWPLYSASMKTKALEVHEFERWLDSKAESGFAEVVDDVTGRTALHLAALHNVDAEVARLVRNAWPAATECEDNDLHTPLGLATKHGVAVELLETIGDGSSGNLGSHSISNVEQLRPLAAD